MQSWEIKRSKCSSPKVGDLGWTNTKVEWSGPKQIQISINWTVLYQKQYGNSDWRKETYWCCQWCLSGSYDLRRESIWPKAQYWSQLAMSMATVVESGTKRWQQGRDSCWVSSVWALFGSCRQWDCRLMVTSVWCRWWDRPLQRWLTGDAL